MESYKVTVVMLLAFLISCGEQVQTSFKLAYEKALASGRSPGEKLLSTYQDIIKGEDCKGGRILTVKEDEVIPSVVSRGEKLNHRIVYTLCRETPLKGLILRKIQRDSKTLMTDKTDYEFKPGKWVIDAFIEVPHNAKEGSYLLESSIEAGSTDHIKRHPFIVR
ncbi:MAG: hypothetical protein ABWK04_05165 [Hydrogenobacter sp.]|uniref:hypothetical protein n=1 Tax=Hydrogenobacter thermophilus TaxID=940 RepID=UPI0030FBF58C